MGRGGFQMIVLETLLRLIGAFYLAGAIFGARRMIFDATIDKAIAALSMKPQPEIETKRRRIVLVGVVLAGVSGMALAVASLWAVPLFALTTASHLYLTLWRTRYDPPQDPSEVRERSQSNVASIAFAVISAGVVVLASQGRLADFADPLRASIILATGIGIVAMLVSGMRWKPTDGPTSFLDDDVPLPINGPRHLSLVANADGWPLSDVETDDTVDPNEVLSADLAAALLDWNRRVVMTANGQAPDPLDVGEDHLIEVRAIIDRMEAELRDTVSTPYREEAMAREAEQRLTSPENCGATDP